MDLPSELLLDLTFLLNDFAPRQTLLRTSGPEYARIAQLPDTLAQKVLRIAKTLSAQGHERFRFNPYEPGVVTEREQETLLVTIWWLQHANVLSNNRAHQKACDEAYEQQKKRRKKGDPKPTRTICSWKCIVCGVRTETQRHWCHNPECVSWTLYHLATGETTLQEAPEAESA